MVASPADAIKHDERDDQQHLQTQRLMALRVIAPPKSRLGQLINDRLAELYARLGEDIDPAQRRQAHPGLKQGLPPELNLDAAEAFKLTSELANSPLPVEKVALGGAANEDRAASNAQLENRAQLEGLPAEVRARENRVPSLASDTSLTAGRMRADQNIQTAQSSNINWVFLLSMLLKTDLKRLGLEPDEFNDIRVLLIKNEAQKYDELKRLSCLPDSLSPEALTKIFDDIRTMAAGYVAFVLIKRAENELQEGEELKQMPEVPRSVSDCFYEIPIIDFDPGDVYKNLNQ